MASVEGLLGTLFFQGITFFSVIHIASIGAPCKHCLTAGSTAYIYPFSFLSVMHAATLWALDTLTFLIALNHVDAAMLVD